MAEPLVPKRRTDRRRDGWRVILRENAYRDAWLLIITGIVTWALVAQGQHVKDLKHEAVERQDQTCLLFEGNQEKAVDQLRQTYDYLVRLTPQERKEPLNRTILATLPQAERTARAAKAPRYCDTPGVGLPEPNPVIPARPPGL